jgi:hypothetical protein
MQYDPVRRSVTMAIEKMVDLGAEFVHINDYQSTMFADNVRRFDDFAEGMTPILLHPFHAQEKRD